MSGFRDVMHEGERRGCEYLLSDLMRVASHKERLLLIDLLDRSSWTELADDLRDGASKSND